MNTEQRLQHIQQLAKNAGASETSISLTQQQNSRIDVRDGKVEKTKSGESQQVSLQVYIDGQFSRHTTNRIDKDSLASFVKDAVEATKFMKADKYRGLPSPELYPKQAIDFGNYDTAIDHMDAEKQLTMAMEAFSSGKVGDNRIITANSTFNTVRVEHHKLNSNGFYGSYKNSHFSRSVGITLQAEDDKRSEESAYASTMKLEQLPTGMELFEEALQRAGSQVGEKKIESGTFDLIIENRVASKFISILQSAMYASALDQKRTFLDGKLGQQITAPHFSIQDSPYLQGGHGSFWFDDEGIAPKQRMLIENGIFKNYLVDNYYGKKLDLDINSQATGNLIFSGNTKAVSKMVQETEKAIKVTSFNGGNSNPSTGDFSFGISGSLIANGSLVRPVSEMVITGNILELFANLKHIGDDPYPFAAMKRPSLYFEKVYCSGL